MSIAPDHFSSRPGNTEPESGKGHKRQRGDILDQLARIKVEMDTAMAERNCEGFNLLCRKRKVLLEQLAATDDKSEISPEIIQALVDDTARWITTGRELLASIREEIERLKPLKRSSRQISNAYGSPPTAGRFFANRG